MISRAFIAEWRRNAPWVDDAQVEQDLVISRALVEVFSRRPVAGSMAFRGGTALYKLYLPAARYSEDIDLVQIVPEAIGPALTAIRASLDAWLGRPRRDFGEGRVTLTYRFGSEGPPPNVLEAFGGNPRVERAGGTWESKGEPGAKTWSASARERR